MIMTKPSLKDIQECHERILPYVHRTAVLQSTSINELAGCQVLFKCENFQKIGAFKARGGMNAVLRLTKEQQQKGLTTHSSGNHAQAIALAAKAVGTTAYIVMPSNAPKIKKRGVEALGGKIIECEPTLAAREKGVEKVIAETGATFIHPFDNDDVISGQATTAKELIEDYGNFDIIMAPVGGGGLLSGTALACHYLSPETEVWAGEPEGAADAILSFESGKVEKAPYINTIADGLLTNLSERTLSIIKQYVKGILLVNDDEIIAAMKLIYERLKIVIEPSCAVPFAALLKNKEQFKGKKVGIILTGGNVDVENLPF
ncbi:MAG: threonine dehydratase [Spirosomataceae bacterium]|jgi:threonine dehydratase